MQSSRVRVTESHLELLHQCAGSPGVLTMMGLKGEGNVEGNNIIIPD